MWLAAQTAIGTAGQPRRMALVTLAELWGLEPGDLDALGGPAWLVARRSGFLEVLAGMALPSEKEEVWRYSPIDAIDLGEYAPVKPGRSVARWADLEVTDDWRTLPGADLVIELLGEGATPAAVVVTDAGTPCGIWLGDEALPGPGSPAASHPGSPAASHPGSPTASPVGRTVLPALEPSDLLPDAPEPPADVIVGMNDVLFPRPVLVGIEDKQELLQPVVIVHGASSLEEGQSGSSPVWFPRTQVRVGAGASVQVIEVFTSGSAQSMVVPVTEMEVGDGATLHYVCLQILGPSTVQIAEQRSRVGTGGSLLAGTIALGGSYSRLRVDSSLDGDRGTSRLLSGYFGSGSQIMDFRTFQRHAAPRTSSDLLFKGAMAEEARSVYTGLITMLKGAAKSDAFQTNRNLVLGERAHADSVPNLDIAENDVRCSHASAVGPVDPDQRYYLESRGIPPALADRLIVLGFFQEVSEVLSGALPGAPGVRAALETYLTAKADAAGLADAAKAAAGLADAAKADAARAAAGLADPQADTARADTARADAPSRFHSATGPRSKGSSHS